MSGSLAAVWLPGREVKGRRRVYWTFSLSPLSKCHPGTISVGSARGTLHVADWRQGRPRRRWWTQRPLKTLVNTQPAWNLRVQRDAKRSPRFLFQKVLQDHDAFMASGQNGKYQLPAGKTQRMVLSDISAPDPAWAPPSDQHFSSTRAPSQRMWKTRSWMYTKVWVKLRDPQRMNSLGLQWTITTCLDCTGSKTGLWPLTQVILVKMFFSLWLVHLKNWLRPEEVKVFHTREKV